MTLSLWAIRHPFLPLLAITLCSLLGLVSLAQMPLRHLPALGHDTVTAQITAPVAASSRTSLASSFTTKTDPPTTKGGFSAPSVAVQTRSPLDVSTAAVRPEAVPT